MLFCYHLLSAVYTTYPVQLNGVNPLLSVLWILCSEVPHAVIYTYVQSALIKLMRLEKNNNNNSFLKKPHTFNGHIMKKVSNSEQI